MSAIRVAFKFIDDKNVKSPPVYQTICGHIIWDIKMEDLRRKTSVISRESVRIPMILAALNDLEMKLDDIQNAYLTAPCQEKICIRVGTEFGEENGKLAII
eukprot:12649822-Ditylum_brightwellii.AAC.1